MPKHNIFIRQGEEVPESLRPLLHTFFNEKALDRLEKFGGRIQVSLTAPFKSNAEKIEITDEFIKTLTDRPENAKDKLKSLTLKQLRNVANNIGLSIASKTSVGQARNLIAQFLQTPEQWKGIAGLSSED
jgi:hypothetical protein